MTADKYYPSHRVFSFKKPSEKIVCPVCGGPGKRLDEKTRKERPCVACKGEGVIKLKQKKV